MAAIICIKESQLREVVEMPEIDLKKFKVFSIYCAIMGLVSIVGFFLI